jgi:hypothetical protein
VVCAGGGCAGGVDALGQVFRVDGGRVQRLRGWTVAGEYRSKSGYAVEPDELVTGLPEVYGSAPAGRLPSAEAMPSSW